MIKDIAHVCLTTTDLAATERFYCEGLGFKKIFEFIRGGERVGFYLQVNERRYIEVFHRESVHLSDRHTMVHICFEVEDIDGVRHRLMSRHIDVTEKKMGGDGSWQMWATDPSGVRLEFHQYTPESAQLTGKDCLLG